MLKRHKIRTSLWTALALAVVLLVPLSEGIAQDKQHPDPMADGRAEWYRVVACGPLLANYRWKHANTTGHPLVGQVYLGNFTGRPPLFPPGQSETDHHLLLSLFHAKFILIGEVHDNPDHHAIQAAFLSVSRCITRSAQNAAVFEHIRQDQAAALVGPREPYDTAAAGLLKRLDWANSGWPDETMFRPLFAAAFEAGMTIWPGEPTRGRVRSVAREGLISMPQDERQRLMIDHSMPQANLDALRAEIIASHCGMLPEQAVDGMSLAQRYRDAHFADAMLEAAKESEQVFLFAGNGHVRKDRGVPWHIRNRDPKAQMLTIILVEVEEGRHDYDAYVPRGIVQGAPFTANNKSAAADLIIFTPRAARPDPCEKMRAMKR